MTTINVTPIGNLEAHIVNVLDTLCSRGAITVEQEDAALVKLDEMMDILLGRAPVQSDAPGGEDGGE